MKAVTSTPDPEPRDLKRPHLSVHDNMLNHPV